jgi:hypothetical protein
MNDYIDDSAEKGGGSGVGVVDERNICTKTKTISSMPPSFYEHFQIRSRSP